MGSPSTHRSRRTTRGTLVIAAGAWAPSLLADLGLPLRVERQLMHWFAPTGPIEPWQVGRHPVWIWEATPEVQSYGFPAYGAAEDGVKVTFYRDGRGTARPTPMPWTGRSTTTRWPGSPTTCPPGCRRCPDGTCAGWPACTPPPPTSTSSIARHPGHATVTVAAGFSGHGFKFAPVVGEILADLALEGTTRHPISLFTPSRFPHP